MGWSPLSPGALRIVVGLVLLANPFVVAEFDVGDPDWYRYEAAEITFDEDGIQVPRGLHEVDPDVQCLETLPTRSCMLELGIHRQGGLEYDGLPDQFLQSEYSHVYLYGEGFFEPVAEGSNGTVRYDLRPVPREEALDDVSIDVDRVPEPTRRVVLSGPMETSDELPGANELVATDDGYYVVHDVAHHETSGERTPFVVTLQWLVGGVGLWLVLRGQRLRVDGRAG